MSIGVKIKTMFGGGAGSVDPSEQLVIVDGSTLYDGRRNGSKLTPRDQIDILQALSNICTREKFTIQAIFNGEPLRKVDHGEYFDEVKVLFAQDDTTPTDLVLEQMNATNLKKIIVVTANVELEGKAAAKGATTLRSATFRKGFEEFSTGQGGGNRRGSSQQRRKRKPGGGGEEGRSGGGQNRSRGGRGKGGGQGKGGGAGQSRGKGGGGESGAGEGGGNKEGGNKEGGNRRSGNRKPRNDKPRPDSNEPDVSDLIDLIE